MLWVYENLHLPNGKIDDLPGFNPRRDDLHFWATERPANKEKFRKEYVPLAEKQRGAEDPEKVLHQERQSIQKLQQILGEAMEDIGRAV